MAKDATETSSTRRTESLIYQIRGQRVMVDRDLAALYGVETRVLNQAVRRNLDRFPDDFMFQLSWDETQKLPRSPISDLSRQDGAATGENGNPSRSQDVILKNGRGQNPKYQPYVFTEQGVAMLSSVLHSPRAIQVNIEIMRAFVRLRQWLASNAALTRRLNDLEQKYDEQFKAVFQAIRKLTTEPAARKTAPRREIGFHAARATHNSKTKALATSR
jgi:hypothetical protein